MGNKHKENSVGWKRIINSVQRQAGPGVLKTANKKWGFVNTELSTIKSWMLCQKGILFRAALKHLSRRCEDKVHTGHTKTTSESWAAPKAQKGQRKKGHAEVKENKKTRTKFTWWMPSLSSSSFCSTWVHNQIHGFGQRNTVITLLTSICWWRGVDKLTLLKTYFSKKAEAPKMVIPGQMQEFYRVKMLM